MVRLGPAALCRIGRRFRQRCFAQSPLRSTEPHESHADQSLLLDDRPAQRIDQPGCWLHSFQLGGPYQAARTAARHVLKNKQIAGAAIDVFDVEPLPPSHPFRTLDNVLATPHVGYVSDGLYKTFYEDTVSNIRKWLDTR